jgi:hypothetical protein
MFFVLRRIKNSLQVTSAGSAQRELIERNHLMHVDHCPVALFPKRAIEIQTSFALMP